MTQRRRVKTATSIADRLQKRHCPAKKKIPCWCLLAAGPSMFILFVPVSVVYQENKILRYPATTRQSGMSYHSPRCFFVLSFFFFLVHLHHFVTGHLPGQTRNVNLACGCPPARICVFFKVGSKAGTLNELTGRRLCPSRASLSGNTCNRLAVGLPALNRPLHVRVAGPPRHWCSVVYIKILLPGAFYDTSVYCTLVYICGIVEAGQNGYV